MPRRLNDDERAALLAERARLVEEHARSVGEIHRGNAAIVRLTLMGMVLLALPLAFNLLHPRGNPAAAAVVGVSVVILVGMAVWQWRRPDERSPLTEDRTFMRLEAAIARDEVRVIDIRADAAVMVLGEDEDEASERGSDAEKPEAGPTIVGHLLRTGPDQILYVPRELVEDLDRDRLPNTHLRITCKPTLEVQTVEALGERLEPLASVGPPKHGPISCGDHSVIVWTPSTDTYEELYLEELEMGQRTYAGFTELAATLLA